jgi:hypothetical protein
VFSLREPESVHCTLLIISRSFSLILAPALLFNRYAFVDSAGPGRAPVTDSNQWVAVWFVVCIFINSFFIKDLFVGVVVDTYNLNFSRLTGAAKLTAAQTEWLDLYKVSVFEWKRKRLCELIEFLNQTSPRSHTLIVSIRSLAASDDA